LCANKSTWKEETIKGGITPGKLADPQDTTKVGIEDIPVPRTIVGGRIVFEA
jgi:hypothetical protein